MLLNASAAIISAIWGNLEAAHAPGFERTTTRSRADLPAIIERASATGWTGILEAETALLAAGIGIPAGDARETLALFDVTPRWLYRRPGSRVTGVMGVERVAVTDLAQMLLQVERLGFPIDPTPLCESLLPGLGSKPLLTQAELAIYWHARERHRSEPLQIAPEDGLTWGRPSETIRTAAGYRAELFRDDGGKATALRVVAPRWRPGRSRSPLAA